MRILKRLLLIVAILASCVGCDQATKSVAKSRLSEVQAVTYLGGTIRLQIAKNYGAFLSFGASMPQTQRTAILSAGVAVVLVALLAYCLASTQSNPIVVPTLAMIVGGGVSNLLDRLFYGGYVVDFLNLGIGPVRTGIFNVADVFIVTGVLLLLFSDRISREFLTKRSTRRARMHVR